MLEQAQVSGKESDFTPSMTAQSLIKLL